MRIKSVFIPYGFCSIQVSRPAFSVFFSGVETPVSAVMLFLWIAINTIIKRGML